jgi:hypothetical protein
MFIALMVRVRRSVDHALPCHVFRATPRSSRVTMLLHRVIDKTPARLNMAVPESCRERRGSLAAFTSAYPSRVSRLNVGTANRCQPSKYLSSQVKSPVAQRLYIAASARLRVPAFQFGAIYHRCCSTLAQAFPVRSPLCDMPALYDYQIVKASPRKINKCHIVPRYHLWFAPSSMTTKPGGMQWQL